jgi:hypothetical protein
MTDMPIDPAGKFCRSHGWFEVTDELILTCPDCHKLHMRSLKGKIDDLVNKIDEKKLEKLIYANSKARSPRG